MPIVAILLATSPLAFATVRGEPALRLAARRLAEAGAALLPVGEAVAVAAALGGIEHLPPAVSLGEAIAMLSARGIAAALLHDASGPGLPAALPGDLLGALGDADAVVPTRPVPGPVWRLDDNALGTQVAGPLVVPLTPIAFRVTALAASLAAGAIDDPLGAIRAVGGRVATLAGEARNPPDDYLTEAADMALAAEANPRPMIPRVGTGFDVHVLAAGRRLMLCGIEVPHETGLAGHSDADVGIHALCDAIYGALAEGDIGRHFPPSEADWKDADSARFLAHAAGRIAARGGRLVNADVTLICERPKIGPHARAMQARLEALLGAAAGTVSVKATTTERLGFAGRGEGIAAQAVATILLPEVSGSGLGG